MFFFNLRPVITTFSSSTRICIVGLRKKLLNVTSGHFSHMINDIATFDPKGQKSIGGLHFSFQSWLLFVTMSCYFTNERSMNKFMTIIQYLDV